MALSLDKFLISTFVFLTFIVGGVMLVHDVQTSYEDTGVDMDLDQYINETYLATTGVLVDSGDDVDLGNLELDNDSYDLSKETQDRMLGKEIDVSDTESSLFSGAFSVFRLVPTSLSLISGVLDQVANEIGIPKIFTRIAFSVLVILVIFGIILLIFRVRA